MTFTLSTKATTCAEFYVKNIKQYFKKIKCEDIPFIICGGCIFDLFQGHCPDLSEFDSKGIFTDGFREISIPIHHNDIDVFFYDIEDYNKIAKNAVEIYNSSKYATSVTIPNLPNVQFIKTITGPIEEIFEYFDLNCSECGFTSSEEFVYSEKFDRKINIKLENLKNNTPARILKYITDKNAHDPEFIEIKRMLDYLISNKDLKIPTEYDKHPFDTCLQILMKFLNKIAYIRDDEELKIKIHKYDVCNIVHERALELFEKENQLHKFFNKIVDIYYNIKFIDPCDEFRLVKYLNSEKITHYQTIQGNKKIIYDWETEEDKHRIMLKYAEYYI